MRYAIQNNDSPALIARTYGVSFDALINANPQKPTTIVNGVRTWQSLLPGETVIVPVGGMVGDAASDIGALVAAGGPCLQANVALVCAAQRAIGVTVDGKWGSNTATAARARVPGAPAGCSPRPSWWAPVGQSNCPPPNPFAAAPAVPAAVQALVGINPCDQANVAVVCAAQRALGVTVDGKYGTTTASAAFRLNPNVPRACSPRPAWWAPVGQSNCVSGAAPAPAPAPAPKPAPKAVAAAVEALVGINLCLQGSVWLVCAAQKELGVTVDGKYGVDTATAARRVLPNAPAGCSPRPSWWKPKGQSNCPGAAQPAPTAKTTTKATTTTTTTKTSGAAVPAAVQALVGINPCLQANSGVVYAAQTALGIKADGKYGPGTAAAARALLVPSAPACSPAPSWWGAKGTAQAKAATDTAKAAATKTAGGATASQTDQAKAAAAAAAAQAADAAAKAAQASTQAQANAAAAAAKAASDAAAKAAAQATTQAEADAAAAAGKSVV